MEIDLLCLKISGKNVRQDSVLRFKFIFKDLFD